MGLNFMKISGIFFWIARCNGGILRSHILEPSIGPHTGLKLSHTDGRWAEGISHGMIKTAWHAGGNGTERRGGRAGEELITVLMSYFIIVFLNATELSFARPFPPHTYVTLRHRCNSSHAPCLNPALKPQDYRPIPAEILPPWQQSIHIVT